MTSVEMRDKRAGLIKQARELWSKANEQPEGPTAEQRQEFDRMIGAAQTFKDEYERLERLEAAESDIATPSQRLSTPFDARPSREGTLATLTDYRASPAYRKIYTDWLINGQMWDFRNRIPAEFRDTILGTDTKGGYLTTPTQLATDIVKLCNDLVFIRQLATVITMGEAKAFGIPQLSARMADANWTTEVQAVTEDTTMAFTRRDLTPWPLTKLSKVSIRMLYADTQIDQFLTTELGYKFALTEEKAYISGSGTNQPLGIFTASANGIPAARDVNIGNTTTAIVAQNIFELKYSLKAPYRNDPTCRWLWSRAAVNQIMQLKDTQSRYLWEPSLQAGQPDRLLNIPVLESEWVPNTFTTGLYVGAIGAFRYYWIAQVDELQIQRLVELYAGTNEVGFIGRRFLDASPALGEAFSRSKLA
jgi:HK97 family phage major capsid protein